MANKRPANKRKGPYGAKAVGSYVPGVAKAAFEAQGFPGASIAAEWPAIAGADMAAYTTPERLIWPKRRHEGLRQDQTAAPERSQRQTGATLVLRVEGPRAIEIQHGAPQIMERVNIYFGYRAVVNLRIIQGPVSRKSAQDEKTRDAPPPDERGLDDIENDGLKAALARLGARVD